jgi:NAD(P)H-hydrate epimerase
VRVAQVGGDAPRTVDAAFERERVLAVHSLEAPRGDEALVVDGVLGTGARGAPRGWAADAVRAMSARRGAGAPVIALDVPTGLDATTGETFGEATLRADATLAFGTCKRGLLVARAHAGTIVVLDIGLGAQEDVDDAPVLAGSALVRRVAPPAAADAHKGSRGRLAIIGGAEGMAGAPTLAAEAALRSGAGLVRCLVARESVAAVQASVPAALAGPWPEDDAALDATVGRWADAALLGPGLGGGARALVERVLRAFRGPVVLDADALNAFAGELPALRAALGGRAALLTPHPLELARLAGVSLAEVLADRFAIGRDVARATGATVLLKGVPTVVSAPRGRRLVVARGTPALATGGSGDVLGGIAVALLAGGDGADVDVLAIGAAAAWVHGRAAELATRRRGGVRGTTLADVLDALSDAWPRAGGRDEDTTTYPVLAELPAVLS